MVATHAAAVAGYGRHLGWFTAVARQVRGPVPEPALLRPEPLTRSR